MECPTSIIRQVFCVCLVLSLGTILLNPAIASETCDFPAIFNFGDSLSDTGGCAATFIAPKWPYGETFFHMPAGRFCDGRLMIDFIAQNLSLPYLGAYLDSLGTNFARGTNFAVAASTIAPQTSIIPNGGFSPFYLDVQYYQFTEFKNRSQIIRKRGGIYKELMPKEEYFSKALYTIEIGGNDIGAGFFGNQSIAQVRASIPGIVDRFSTNVKNLYNTGARSFWIHNTGPMGCYTYFIVGLPNVEFDSAGCAKNYNEVCQYFNLKLKQAVAQLRKDLPLAALTYVDIYTAKYTLISQPAKYGFELPLVACCGYGGKYNFSSVGTCGDTVTVNGTQFTIDSCASPWKRVSWDGVHSTEAANKFYFDLISTGAFSDPPIPLKRACHRK